MRYSDYLDASPPPIGPFRGDRRMDQVEDQRADMVYGINPAPGFVCFDDGSCITQEEYDQRYSDERPYPQPGPPPAYTGNPLPGGRVVIAQDTGRQAAMPGAGPTFAMMLQEIMAQRRSAQQPVATPNDSVTVPVPVPMGRPVTPPAYRRR